MPYTEHQAAHDDALDTFIGCEKAESMRQNIAAFVDVMRLRDVPTMPLVRTTENVQPTGRRRLFRRPPSLEPVHFVSVVDNGWLVSAERYDEEFVTTRRFRFLIGESGIVHPVMHVVNPNDPSNLGNHTDIKPADLTRAVYAKETPAGASKQTDAQFAALFAHRDYAALATIAQEYIDGTTTAS